MSWAGPNPHIFRSRRVMTMNMAHSMSAGSVCCEILQQQKCFRQPFTALHGKIGLKTGILWLPAILMVLEYICNDLGRTKSIYLEVKVGDVNEHWPTAWASVASAVEYCSSKSAPGGLLQIYAVKLAWKQAFCSFRPFWWSLNTYAMSWAGPSPYILRSRWVMTMNMAPQHERRQCLLWNIAAAKVLPAAFYCFTW